MYAHICSPAVVLTATGAKRHCNGQTGYSSRDTVEGCGSSGATYGGGQVQVTRSLVLGSRDGGKGGDGHPVRPFSSGPHVRCTTQCVIRYTRWYNNNTRCSVWRFAEPEVKGTWEQRVAKHTRCGAAMSRITDVLRRISFLFCIFFSKKKKNVYFEIGGTSAPTAVRNDSHNGDFSTRSLRVPARLFTAYTKRGIPNFSNWSPHISYGIWSLIDRTERCGLSVWIDKVFFLIQIFYHRIYGNFYFFGKTS